MIEFMHSNYTLETICRLNFHIPFTQTQVLLVTIYIQGTLDLHIRLMTHQKFRQQFNQTLELPKCKGIKSNIVRFIKHKRRYRRLLSVTTNLRRHWY